LKKKKRRGPLILIVNDAGRRPGFNYLLTFNNYLLIDVSKILHISWVSINPQ